MAATTLASTVVDNVLRRLNQNTSSPKYWSRAEILDLVWEGLLEATLISGHLQKTIEVTLTGNSIQAAPEHVAVLHARIGNNSLQKYSVDELDTYKPNWDAEPQAVNPIIWAPIGTTQLLTHPRTSATSKSVFLTVLEYPATLAEGTTIAIEDEYVVAVEDYAFSVARLKEGGQELRDAISDYDKYLQRTGELTERVAWKNAPEWAKTPKTRLSPETPRQQRVR